MRAGALVALTFLYLAALVRPAVLGPGGFPGMTVLGLAALPWRPSASAWRCTSAGTIRGFGD